MNFSSSFLQKDNGEALLQGVIVQRSLFSVRSSFSQSRFYHEYNANQLQSCFFLHHDPSPPYNPHWRFWLDCHRPYNRCFPLVFNSWSFNEVILRSTHYHTLVSNTVLAAVAENHVAMASVCAFGGCSVCGVLCDWSFLGWANVSVMKNQTGQVMFSFWTVLLGFIWESKGTPPQCHPPPELPSDLQDQASKLQLRQGFLWRRPCDSRHLWQCHRFAMPSISVRYVDPTTSWRLPILFRMMLTCRFSLLWLYKCKIKIHMDDIAAYSSPASEICLSYHFAGLFQFFLWILLCWSMPVLCTDEAYCNLNANCSSFSFCGNSCYLKKAGRRLVAMVLDRLSLCCTLC